MEKHTPDSACYQEGRLANLEQNKDEFNRFRGTVESSITNIEKNIIDIRDNDLRHINVKINCLLFTVLASVFASVIIISVTRFMK